MGLQQTTLGGPKNQRRNQYGRHLLPDVMWKEPSPSQTVQYIRAA